MVAILTGQGPTIERSVTFVTESTCSLHRLTSEEVFLGGSLKDGQRGDRRSPGALEVFIHPNRRTLGLFLSTVVFGPLGRVSRAFLAPRMLAGDANLIGAKRNVTSMACTAYADAHDLFHPFRIPAGRRCPFARFEPKPILHEHGTSFLLLDGIADGGGFSEPLAGLCESRLGILD